MSAKTHRHTALRTETHTNAGVCCAQMWHSWSFTPRRGSQQHALPYYSARRTFTHLLVLLHGAVLVLGGLHVVARRACGVAQHARGPEVVPEVCVLLDHRLQPICRHVVDKVVDQAVG